MSWLYYLRQVSFVTVCASLEYARSTGNLASDSGFFPLVNLIVDSMWVTYLIKMGQMGSARGDSPMLDYTMDTKDKRHVG